MGFDISSLFGKKPSTMQKLSEEKLKAQKEISNLNKELITISEQKKSLENLKKDIENGKSYDDIIKDQEKQINDIKKQQADIEKEIKKYDEKAFDEIKKATPKFAGESMVIGLPEMEKAENVDAKREGFILQIPASNPLLLDA